MEKALEVLKELSNFRSGEIIVSIDFEIKIAESIEELEAINLTRREWYQKGFNEAMQPKTCKGCKYDQGFNEMSNECYVCSRNLQDQYEPKDNA